MNKQLNRKLFKTVLLLISIITMVAWLSTAVVAGSGDPTLTLTFNKDECTVILDYGSATEPIEMVSGTTYTIPYSDSVTVTVNPKPGFELADILDSANQSIKYNGDEISGYYEQDFTTPVTATVTCSTKSYEVDYEKEGVLYSYQPATGTWADYKSDYRYRDSENLTKLPVVYLEGYTFGGWQWIDSDGSVRGDIPVDGNGDYYIPYDLVVTKNMEDTGKIYVHAVLTPTPQPVIRQDHIYEAELEDCRGNHLGTTNWTAFKDDVISALTQMSDDAASDDPSDLYKNFKKYVGYELVTDYDYKTHTVFVPSDVKKNIVYRLYKAIEYNLVFENLADGQFVDENGEETTPPTSYVYAHSTRIPNMRRTGYDFLGWELTVIHDGTPVSYTVSTDFMLGLNDANIENYISDDKTIVIKARWQAQEFRIDYDWNGKDADQNAALELMNATLPKKFEFDSDAPISTVSISNPVRNGYTFTHWVLTYMEGGVEKTRVCTPTEGTFVLNCNEYAQNIRLTAQWEAKTYSIKLDGNGATVAGSAKIDSVVFDSPLNVPAGLIPPTRTGFTFDGYWSAKEGGVQYIDGELNSVCECWDLYAADSDGAITLFAQWKRNSYNVTVNVTGVPSGVEGLKIVLREKNGTEHPYGTESIALPFETEFTVIITAPNGYKTVKWNGTALDEHQAVFTSASIKVDAADMTLTASTLVMIEVPEININYVNETLQLPNGKYRIYLQGVALDITVHNGAITVNGETAEKIAIPEAFLGETVKVICYGDATATSDSEPKDLFLVARPNEPKTPDEIHSIDNTYDTQIKVNMVEGLDGIYEFAVSENSDLAGLTWSDSPLLEGLNPGTGYYVFIRVKATESAPHGKAYTAFYTTRIQSYVPEKTKELEDLLTDVDGDIANALIKDAIDRINELAAADKLSETFFIEVEKIVADAKAQLPFARLQDEKITSLENKLDDNLQTGSFTPENVQILKDLCSNAVAQISASNTAEEVNGIYESTVLAMEAVPVTYLYDTNHIITLISKLGLPQGSGLSFVRFTDFVTLSRAVDEAIRTSGKVTVDSFLTQEEAEQLVRTLDVMAAYHFDLTNATPEAGDRFTVRLQIPEELKGATGLQVAYYDETSGTLELLYTEVDGDELVFEADRIADFVILADSTLDLTPFIGILGGIILCQLIAIAMILVSRSKNAGIAVYSFTALPVTFLAVRFQPFADAWIVLLVMGALVVLLQAFLMYLLISSNMVHLRKRAPKPPKKKHGMDVSDKVQDDSNAAFAPTEGADETLADASAEEAQGEDAAEDALSEENAMPSEEEEEASPEDDPFAVYDDDAEASDAVFAEENPYGDDWYAEETVESDEDFIEPAANPRYSLPGEDEDFASYDDQADVEEQVTYYDEEAPAEEEYAADAYAEESYTEDFALAAEESDETYAYDDANAAYTEEEYSAGEYLQDAQSYDEVFGESLEEGLEEELFDEAYAEEETVALPEEGDDREESDADAQANDDQTDSLYHYDE